MRHGVSFQIVSGDPVAKKTSQAKTGAAAKSAAKATKPKRRNTQASPLFTIGYEHTPARAVHDALADAKVDVLVDVRAVSSSRRPGFSKRQLAAGLDEQGIGYLHLQGLGTPKDGRLAARSGDLAQLFKIYEKHLKTPQAREELDELTALVRAGRRVCLLCYERDAHRCHRRRIAELLSERTGVRTQDLVPDLM
jgi:uncharacterized protein (DUF488 family)